MVAGSIQETLEHFGLSSNIKLPNDVHCNGKKIAGILINSTIQGKDSVAYVGIGINVNNDTSKKEGIASISTSISRELARKVDLTDFTISLIERLDTKYYVLLRSLG